VLGQRNESPARPGDERLDFRARAGDDIIVVTRIAWDESEASMACDSRRDRGCTSIAATTAGINMTACATTP
jgi:hypothetical protein